MKGESGGDVPTITSSSLFLNHRLTILALGPGFSGSKIPCLLAYSGERVEKSKWANIPSWEFFSSSMG